MAQTAKQKNKSNSLSDSVVETFWNQYEDTLARFRKQSDERSQLYLNALKQTTKFNEEYRTMLRGFYKETRQVNEEISKKVSTSVSEKMELGSSEDSEKLQDQWQNVSFKLQEISLSPYKQTFNMMSKLEKRIEQNTENFIEYNKSRRKAWSSVTDDYLKVLRDRNKNINRRLEDSFRTLTNSTN
jgi:hypothetical protein